MFNLLKIKEIFLFCAPFNIIELIQMVNNLPLEKNTYRKLSAFKQLDFLLSFY